MKGGKTIKIPVNGTNLISPIRMSPVMQFVEEDENATLILEQEEESYWEPSPDETIEN